MSGETHDEPSKVVADAGVVRVDGPDGVDVALTPEAALETGDRLIEGATTAMGQRLMDEAKGRETAPNRQK